MLAELVGPLVRQLSAQRAIERWFFIRFADPDWHLRLRFGGDPRRLSGEVLPLLQEMVAPLLADGRVWRLQLDTYERELERYGADRGIVLAERFFQIDSEAVLSIVENLDGDAGADGRWLLAARGIDRLLSDLGFELSEKLDLLAVMQSSSAQLQGSGRGLRKQLADRLRRERRNLEDALEPVYDAAHPLAFGYRALERRSQQLAPVVAELRAAEREGQLAVSLRDLAISFVHMFTNRLCRSDGPAHELVLYDFLLRLTESRAARERAAEKRGARERPAGKGSAEASAARPRQRNPEPAIGGH